MKIYLASSLNSNCRGDMYKTVEMLRAKGMEVYAPVEHKIPNAWDYPKTLLVVSDMQFNPSSYRGRVTEQTNYETAMTKLRAVFPEEFVNEFKIIWWYCANRKTSDFPSTMDDAGTYMVSGYDGAIISFLLGGDVPVKVDETGKKVQPSMEDIINAAFSQEALALIK